MKLGALFLLVSLVALSLEVQELQAAVRPLQLLALHLLSPLLLLENIPALPGLLFLMNKKYCLPSFEPFECSGCTLQDTCETLLGFQRLKCTCAELCRGDWDCGPGEQCVSTGCSHVCTTN
ncbi:protein Wfdc21-like [Psammomys obesus]|uniref:protein Wfdc21-like n=1 Tax=Psammomys obesus TaxID=48139 RepID=UPI0024535822|nr:protein Wfdc21-like [Psammomys obesus]